VRSKHVFASPNFAPFSRKCAFLLRPSPFFKRPSLASPNFPKNAIRSRLCGPNTLPPLPFSILFYAFFAKMHWFAAPRPCFTAPKPHLAVFRKKRDPLAPVQSKHAFVPPHFALFSRKCFVLLRPSPAFLCPSPASPNFARKAIRLRLCGPNTLPSIPFWSVFVAFLFKVRCSAAPRPCFAAPRPWFADFREKNAPLTPVQSKHTFAHPFCKRLLSKCVALLRQGSALLPPGPPLPLPVCTLPRPSFALPPPGSALLRPSLALLGPEPALLRPGLALPCQGPALPCQGLALTRQGSAFARLGPLASSRALLHDRRNIWKSLLVSNLTLCGLSVLDYYMID